MGEVVPFNRAEKGSEVPETTKCLRLIDKIQESLGDHVEKNGENEALELGAYGEMDVNELVDEFGRLQPPEEHHPELVALDRAVRAKLDELYGET